MLNPALKYLTLRSLGAPAVLLSLATQGVFRGFKDTKTPLYATGMQRFNVEFSPLFGDKFQFEFFLVVTVTAT